MRPVLVLGPDSVGQLTPMWNSVRLLCEHGYQVRLFSALHDPAASPYRHPLLKTYSKIGLRGFGFARFWLSAFGLALRRPLATWIHSPGALKHPVAALARFAGSPIIYHAHEIYDRETHGDRLRWADLVLSPDAGRSAIMKDWLAPHARIMTLPNSRYHRQPHASGRLRRLAESRGVTTPTLCIYQGLIAARRNLIELIDAMREVDDDAGLVLIGGGAPEDLAACDERIRGNGLTGRVVRLDPVGIEEILELTVDADIGILFYDQSHSLNNRLCAPNKLFEYMMLGLPMLGTRCPGLDQYFSKIELGELVDSSDPAEIAAGINRLCRDRERRLRIANQSQAAFLSEYQYERLARPLLEYLEHELRHREAGGRAD